MKSTIVRKLAILSLAALALSPLCRAQSQIIGDWQGTLTAGGTPFRIAWHVTAAKDGSLTSTLDNIDQSIFGIPVKSIALDGSRLTLIVDDVIQVNGESVNLRGTLEGTIDKDASELKGTWTQSEPEQPPAELSLKRVHAQAAANPAVPPGITGAWQGTLRVGSVQLRQVLHISAAKDGTLTATMDSVDQGAFGIPVSAITLSDSRLKLTLDNIHGVYVGIVNKDATEIDGTWSQGTPLELNFKRATPPSDIDGLWLGTLDAGAVKLRLILRIFNASDGMAAILQSPDQGPQWIPASSIKRSGSSLNFTIDSLGVVFDGKFDAGLNSIDGTFTQGGKPLPLALKRIKDQAELQTRHPQNPVKPYPYREEEVTYANKAAGNTLAGTVTIPPGKGPFRAVLLISGSGPNDRDETVFGHKPFLVLSDYLTRKGIVVLRADKRGIGKSTGDLAKATTADFASDAEAGVTFLKTRPEVDPQRIGLIGHSEGGTIAPMVAAGDPGVRFIVLMAGPGVPGDQLIVEQKRLIEEASGVTKEQAAQDAVRQRELFTLVETEKDDAVLEKELRAKMAGHVSEAMIDAGIQQLMSPWWRYTLTYDPATALRKVTCPVLALNGEKDLQVPPALDLPAIRKALEEGGNKHVEIDELPGLNHLFQTAKTGAPTEYALSEETISPVALDKIAAWILKQ
jgi:pimeloyl-ACP methyl ester carboxylesterase